MTNAFAIDLFHELRLTQGNLFFSPHSVAAALAMTWGGAKGDTAGQLATALHLGPDPTVVHEGFTNWRQALVSIRDQGEVELYLANSLWPDLRYPLVERFLDLARRYYGVLITGVDYGDEQAARTQINAWVEDNTNHRITDLVAPGDLSDLTQLVLANAIYFKGNWAHQFDIAVTQDEAFHLLDGQTAVVPLMHQKRQFFYGETHHHQVLTLPYEGYGLQMLVILPKAVKDLPELEADLSTESLSRWTQGQHEYEVDVYLPRFTFATDYELNQPLKHLGITDAFSPNADFTGIVREGPFFLDLIVHKAFLAVNEEGAEAAAATAATVTRGGSPGGPVVFRADHPFLVLIQEWETGRILFMGRVVDPRG